MRIWDLEFRWEIHFSGTRAQAQGGRTNGHCQITDDELSRGEKHLSLALADGWRGWLVQFHCEWWDNKGAKYRTGSVCSTRSTWEYFFLLHLLETGKATFKNQNLPGFHYLQEFVYQWRGGIEWLSQMEQRAQFFHPRYGKLPLLRLYDNPLRNWLIPMQALYGSAKKNQARNLIWMICRRGYWYPMKTSERIDKWIVHSANKFNCSRFIQPAVLILLNG